MATIRCENCGRYIQDSDRNCLYCNTPNAQYKESIYESSFGSFGSSFCSGSFSTVKSSFESNRNTTDFGVGQDFVDVGIPLQPEAQHKEEQGSFGRMSSFFDCSSEQKENDTQKIQSTAPTKPDSSQVQSASCNSTDYKERLDNYRKKNGYGEYASTPQRSRQDAYKPSRTNKSKNGLSVEQIIFFICLINFGPAILRFIFELFSYVFS